MSKSLTEMPNTEMPIHVVGGGMAGCEAAWQIAEHGIPVIMHEMRPVVKTDVHQSEDLAELVCSNSFRSDDHEANAVGVLHQEMRMLGSLLMDVAKTAQVPAGSALAVDRELFSAEVTKRINAHPLITVERGEISELPPEDWGPTIIATGPLTSAKLSEAIRTESSEDQLAFFDAIAPIVHHESIDFSKAWYQSRYDKVGPGGDGKDYINLPMDEAQYEGFIDDLINSEKADFKEFEKNTPYFEACLPIEVMAERGRETLRFGPMKPVGLTNPHQPTVKAHAVVQLRQDNKLGTLYNLVGFQTKMKYGAQVETLRKIPGLENAEFARLGGIHRNTFMKSPALLDNQMRLKSKPWLRFAGQMTGVEGYVESASMGLMVGRMVVAERQGNTLTPPPQTTAHGALIAHITGEAELETFQPMNVNFGLMPSPELQITPNGKRKKLRGRERKAFMAARALEDFQSWMTASSLTLEI